MGTSSYTAGPVVVGYFRTGHEAHRAINALIEAGFQPSEIGAAFHVHAPGTGSTNAGEPTRPEIGGSLREELGTTHDGQLGASPSYGGPNTGSSGVQPNITGTGSGTHFSGPSRPGPITGSSLAHSGLPTELEHSLPSDNSIRSEADTEGGSWHNRLHHVFRPKDADADRPEDRTPKAPVTKESQNFGTGEGHLMLNTPSQRPYSQPAFERGFTGAGFGEHNARSLSHRIGGGGALVSVHATARASEAERILEQHSGQIRHESYSGAGQPGTGHVEVFGTLDRDYDRDYVI